MYKLFDNFERTDTNRDNFRVERYTFLNNSAIPKAEAARKKIIGWSEGFLIKPDFLKKFRSKNNRQHTAALFELFVFYNFKSQGFAIENIDVAGTPTPDFRITTEEGPIYIECTCASSSNFDEGIDNLQSAILDSFSKLDKQSNFINIEWLQCSHSNPSLKKIRSLINNFINATPRPSSLMIEDSGWRIKVTLIPSSEKVKRGIGTISSPFGIVTPQVNVLAALEEKRPGKYKLNAPYIIAIHSEDPFLDDLDIELALFDGAIFQDKLPLKRASGNVFFIAKNEWANRSVSAVLIVQKMQVYDSAPPRIKMWHHPEGRFPIKPDLFNLPQRIFIRTDEVTFKVVDIEPLNPNLH